MLTGNFNSDSSQLGIRFSGTRNCSQGYAIDHFSQGNISAIQPSVIQHGKLCFYRSNVRYIDDAKLKLDKFSELEFGVFQVARRLISKFTVQA